MGTAKAKATPTRDAVASSETTKDVVAMALINSEGALDEVRDYLDKMVAAHALVMGSWDPGDSIFDAQEDDRIGAFGRNAATVVANVQSLSNYFAEIRQALSIEDSDDLALDEAAEE